MNPTESEILLDVAVLGEQVDQFLKSDIGRYLMQHIDDEYDKGIAGLINADCHVPYQVQTAQNQVRRAEQMRDWLREAIAAGLRARMILEDREE